jgi:hypothetical protein
MTIDGDILSPELAVGSCKDRCCTPDGYSYGQTLFCALANCKLARKDFLANFDFAGGKDR